VKGGFLEEEPSGVLQDGAQMVADQFFRAVQHCWAEKQQTDMIVSTHDHQLVNSIVEWLEEQNMQPNDRRVVFSQDYPMGSHVTYGLLNEEYNVVKRLSYGQLEHLLPRLARHLQQTGFAVPDVKGELPLLRKEVLRRILEDHYIV
jgi:proline dehydrogenase